MEGKKTIDIDIIVTSRNGDKKNHANYQNNKQTSLDIKEVEPVWANSDERLYQSNTYQNLFQQFIACNNHTQLPAPFLNIFKFWTICP